MHKNAILYYNYFEKEKAVNNDYLQRLKLLVKSMDWKKDLNFSSVLLHYAIFTYI